MKSVILVSEGLADEPVEELEHRTPLELAKTPSMDELAKQGRLGSAHFLPQALPAQKDIACMAALGYDPLEFYTGLAPLCALGFGVDFDDRPVVFRCDLVTVSQERLIDATGGRVGGREAEALLETLTEKLGGPRFRFVCGRGHKNILLVTDPEFAEDFDQLQSEDPALCVGQPLARHLPRGRGSSPIQELIEHSQEVLGEHEINRVRLDLGENPANLIWLWGQGKKPKLPSFEQQFGAQLAVVSTSDFVQGLGLAAGGRVFSRSEDIEIACKDADLVFVYVEAGTEQGVKGKIKRIEDFDGVVRRVLQDLSASGGEWRVCVVSDALESHKKKTVLRDAVPFVIAGSGIASSGDQTFSEKNCAQNGIAVQPGHSWVGHVLKKRVFVP